MYNRLIIVYCLLVLSLIGIVSCDLPAKDDLGKASGDFPAKNVILMISDGQGFGTVMATDFYQGASAVYESFPNKYFMTTYSMIGNYDPEKSAANFSMNLSKPTDSAAAATAMGTGQKTLPFVIGKSACFNRLENIVEVASQLDKATGVVTSVPISHATPAAMSVHNSLRINYMKIARDMIYDSDLDLIMGGGHPYFDNNGEPKEKGWFEYIGGKSTFGDLTDEDGAQAKDRKTWTFIDDIMDFEDLAAGDLSSDKVIGIAQVAETLQQERDGDCQVPFNDPFIPEVPTLKQMTKGALNVLNQNTNGFFLMVEGGAVDWANHNNEKGRVIEEQTDFNNTVETVVDWIEDDTNGSSWENTLLIVTADHDTGYIWGASEKSYFLVGDNGPGNVPEMHYHAKEHSNIPVPLYANGVGADIFDLTIDGFDTFLADLIYGFDPDFDGAYVDNTDVFTVMHYVLTTNSVESVD